MTRLPWIFAATVTLAAMPAACLIVDNGPGGYGGYGTGHGGQGSGGGPATGDACNPVTGAGCPADGSTCDLDGTTGFFACFPPPNDVAVCGACDNSTAFCSAQLTCVLSVGDVEGTCYRYCCTDGDCGAGGSCDLSLGKLVLQAADPNDAVGLCVQGDAPACGPASVASGGACVGGYGGGKDGGGGKGDGGGTGGGTDGGGTDGGGMIPDGGHAGRHDGGHGDGG